MFLLKNILLLLKPLVGLALVFLPFILNFYLAKSRSKSVILMLLLTLVFSWIVTLILAFMPQKLGNT